MIKVKDFPPMAFIQKLVYYHKVFFGPVAVRFFMIMVGFIGLTFLSGCDHTMEYEEKPLKELYQSAQKYLKEKKYKKAGEAFDQVYHQYPYTDEAAQAHLFSAYCFFQAKDYGRAISILDLFIALHPSSSSSAYAYYLRGMSYFQNITIIERDKESAELALQAMQEIQNRFPNTPYAEKAKQKEILASLHVGSCDLAVAKKYYEKKQYAPALVVLNDCMGRWCNTPLYEEILYREIECLHALGLEKSAQRHAALLAQRYPTSPWIPLVKKFLNRK